ncbi:MAG TPA: hypothetical protein VHX37_08385 [Acidobacteriaceae bacterium]|jgi:hypothetical protein|nr:hypothetical protein [Acidobacteriaceae bacterium]
MITANEISARVQQLSSFKSSLDQFDEWLTKTSWNMHLDSDPNVVKMVGCIERYLGEFDSGLISEPKLLSELERMAGIVDVRAGDHPNVRIVSSGSVDIQPVNIRFGQSVDAGKQFGLEFSTAPPLPA